MGYDISYLVCYGIELREKDLTEVVEVEQEWRPRDDCYHKGAGDTDEFCSACGSRRPRPWKVSRIIPEKFPEPIRPIISEFETMRDWCPHPFEEVGVGSLRVMCAPLASGGGRTRYFIGEHLGTVDESSSLETTWEKTSLVGNILTGLGFTEAPKMYVVPYAT